MTDRRNRLNQPDLRPGLRPQRRLHRENDSRRAGLQGERAPHHSPSGEQDEPSALIPVSGPPPAPTGGARTYPSTEVVEGQWRPLWTPRPGIRKAGQAAASSAQMWGMLLIGIIVLVWGAGLVVGFQTSLAVLMGLSLLLALVGLLSPALGILAIGMLAALDAMANIFLLTGGWLRFNTISYFLVIVMALNIPFILRLRNFNARAFQVFLLLLALEISFSSDKSRGVQDVLNMGVTFGMVVYFARALKDELSLYWLGLVNGVLAGLGGLIFFFQMDSLPYANPNDWTYFNLTALFSICIAYSYAIKHHQNRILLLALAAVNFGWVFLSGSRGSLLVAALAGVYLFLATRSITWKTVMVGMAFIVGVWLTATFVEEQAYMIQRIQMLFDPTITAERRTSQRSSIAEAGIIIFERNPLGVGTGSFEQESARTGALFSGRPAHSAWIKVLAENGIPGIFLLVVFISSFALVGLKQPKEGRLLFALFITLTLALAFIAKEFRGKSLWFLVAAGIALLHPEEMISNLSRKLKETGQDYTQRLREVRFGQRR